MKMTMALKMTREIGSDDVDDDGGNGEDGGADGAGAGAADGGDTDCVGDGHGVCPCLSW